MELQVGRGPRQPPRPHEMRPMMTATVLLVLLAGHLLGDWVTQTD